MDNAQVRIPQCRRSERGSAALVAMIFLAVAALTVLTLMAKDGLRDSRVQSSSYERMSEKWQARSAVNILSAVIRTDVKTQFDADVKYARVTCNVRYTLSYLDEPSAGASVPAVTFSNNAPQCTNQAAPTSIFGNITNWRNGRIPAMKSSAAAQFGISTTLTDVVEFSEIYRRKNGDSPSDMAYAVQIIIEGKIGNYRTRATSELILGNQISNCLTSGTLTANNTTVERGQPFQFSGTWSYTNRVRVFNSAGVVLFDSPLTETNPNGSGVFPYTPTATDSYYALYEGSGGCSALTARINVTVTEPPPVCPQVNAFSATPNPVTTGGNMDLVWNVTDAVSVRVTRNGGTVSSSALSGSRTYGGINSTQTIILTATSFSGGCNVTQQIDFSVKPPACAYVAPVVSGFSVDRASIALGESANLSWNVGGIESGGTVRITGANGFNQTVGATGSAAVSPPNTPADYTYTLTTENVCPDGTKLMATRTVTIAVRACPTPVITAYTINPATVSQYANQYIRFSWSISGTIDAVSISGVGGGLPAFGAVDFLQPNNSTSYTLTAVGCGQTVSQTVSLTVNSCPSPVINSFSSNMTTVAIGGSQTIRLSWSLSGTNNTISIDGIGNVSGTYIDIAQPQSTTTYTIRAGGCSSEATAQVTLKAINPPPPANSCGNYPGFGDLDYRAGLQGMGGYGYAGTYGSSEFRVYYKASHYTDNRYRFNMSLYISSLQYSEFSVVNSSGYMIEIGDQLRANFDSGGVNFYKANGTFIQRSNWAVNYYTPMSGRNFGYRYYELEADIFNTAGVNVPLDAFNPGTPVKTNPFVLSAASIPYDSSPSTLVNTGSSGSGGGLFACP